MIRSWNYAFNDSGPNWGKDLFKGIDMISNDSIVDLSHYNFDGIVFSFSYFRNMSCWSANWSRCVLDNCTFDNVRFITSLFFRTSIQNIKRIDQPFQMNACTIVPGGFPLLNVFKTTNMDMLNPLDSFTEKTIIRSRNYRTADLFITFSGFLKYGLQKSLFTIATIKTLFDFEDEKTKLAFFKKLDEFKKYEVKKKKTVKKESPKKE